MSYNNSRKEVIERLIGQIEDYAPEEEAFKQEFFRIIETLRAELEGITEFHKGGYLECEVDGPTFNCDH